ERNRNFSGPISAEPHFKASDVCFVSKGSGHHRYVSSGVQEIFSTGKTCSYSYLFTACIESTNSSSSVDTAFYVIKWAHEIVGVASPTASLPSRTVKWPIVEGADLSNVLQLRNVCLYMLSFAGFFRSEEVLNINMSNIRFFEGFMIIKVDKSKTDQFRQGDEVVIAQSEGNVCPVFLLKEYLKKLDISPDSSEFIFRPLVKTKSSYK
ncbi:unnamed protein product, partial [Porites evermanni]